MFVPIFLDSCQIGQKFENFVSEIFALFGMKHKKKKKKKSGINLEKWENMTSKWMFLGIRQYFELYLLAEFHLSFKLRLLIYKYNYKEKNSKIPSKNEEIIYFC